MAMARRVAEAAETRRVAEAAAENRRAAENPGGDGPAATFR